MEANIKSVKYLKVLVIQPLVECQVPGLRYVRGPEEATSYLDR